MNDTSSRTETLRDIVLFAAEIAAAGATIYLAYKTVFSQDAQRMVRMRIARGTARVAKTQADWWATLAANADTYYWQTASV
jgi:hypothetical protein